MVLDVGEKQLSLVIRCCVQPIKTLVKVSTRIFVVTDIMLGKLI